MYTRSITKYAFHLLNGRFFVFSFCFVSVLFSFLFILIQVRWPCIKFKSGLAAINLIMHVLAYSLSFLLSALFSSAAV